VMSSQSFFDHIPDRLVKEMSGSFHQVLISVRLNTGASRRIGRVYIRRLKKDRSIYIF
jgi:hypothetical protein